MAAGRAKPGKALRLALAGAQGRMGKAVLSAALSAGGWTLASAWERPGHPELGRDAGEAAGLGRLGVALASAPDLSGADVAVDFSSPASTLATVAAAAAARVPVVIGTTGFDPRQRARLQAAARRIPMVMASNYSVGMNLLWKALQYVAHVTRDAYDVEIIEAHHHHKADSPSGTAMTTAEVLARALGRELPVWARFGRPKGVIGPRDPREIGLHTVRGGDIIGDHTVLFAGPGERLEFKHQAHSRDNFARGALLAARWLAEPGRRPGIHGMARVLGLE